jgi:hypothetical protein
MVVTHRFSWIMVWASSTLLSVMDVDGHPALISSFTLVHPCWNFSIHLYTLRHGKLSTSEDKGATCWHVCAESSTANPQNIKTCVRIHTDLPSYDGQIINSLEILRSSCNDHVHQTKRVLFNFARICGWTVFRTDKQNWFCFLKMLTINVASKCSPGNLVTKDSVNYITHA